MIHAIRCENPGFKSVEFTEGLNLIVADRLQDSASTDTRNGVGKSTLIQILQFCLGGSIKKGSTLEKLALKDSSYEFTLVARACENRIALTRGIVANKKIRIIGLPERDAIKANLQEELDGSYTGDEKSLGDFLGACWFGLDKDGSGQRPPGFRTLMRFIARYDKDAFTSPFKAFGDMPSSTRRTAAAFLLHLGWEYVNELEAVEANLKTIRNKVKTLTGTGSGASKMENELSDLDVRRAAAESELAQFKVVENYAALRQAADEVTIQLTQVRDARFEAEQLLDQYRAEMPVESENEVPGLAELYEEVQFFFPNQVRKSLDDVRRFHAQIEKNRKARLAEGVVVLERRIEQSDQDEKRLDSERSSLLNDLAAGGALEEFLALQNRLSGIRGRIEFLRQRLNEIADAEKQSLEVERSRTEVASRAYDDHLERAPLRRRAQELFSGYIRRLYDRKGELQMDFDKKEGFRFDAHCPRDGAEGVESMLIFCYDLMIAVIWAEFGTSPRFLVHDTTMFDAVEERQRGIALDLAKEESERHGFQYISFWNTDSIPATALGGRSEDYVRLRLDDSAEGSLLGFYFD